MHPELDDACGRARAADRPEQASHPVRGPGCPARVAVAGVEEEERVPAELEKAAAVGVRDLEQRRERRVHDVRDLLGAWLPERRELLRHRGEPRDVDEGQRALDLRHVRSGPSRSQSSVRRGTNGTSSRIEPAEGPELVAVMFGILPEREDADERRIRSPRGVVPEQMQTQPEEQTVATWSLQTVAGHNVAIARSGFRWSVVARGSEVVSASLDDALRQTLARLDAAG